MVSQKQRTENEQLNTINTNIINLLFLDLQILKISIFLVSNQKKKQTKLIKSKKKKNQIFIVLHIFYFNVTENYTKQYTGQQLIQF